MARWTWQNWKPDADLEIGITLAQQLLVQLVQHAQKSEEPGALELARKASELLALDPLQAVVERMRTYRTWLWLATAAWLLLVGVLGYFYGRS